MRLIIRKKRTLALGLCGLLAFSSAFAKDIQNLYQMGFDFIAPAIYDRTQAPEQTGSIVYDTTDQQFYGNADGVWKSFSAAPNLLVTSSVTSAYTALNSDDVILADGTSSAFTITLPAAASNSGKQFTIKRTDSTIANVVTVDGNGSETIDGNTTTTLNTQNESITIVSDGSNWQLLNRSIPSEWTDFPSTAAGTLITGTSSNPTYGTVSRNEAKWRRVGDSMEIMWSYVQTAAGSAGSGSYLFNLPYSLSIDTNKLTVNSSSTTPKGPHVGTGSAWNGSNRVTMLFHPYSSTELMAEVSDASGEGTWGSAMPFSTTVVEAGFQATVPISGWNN